MISLGTTKQRFFWGSERSLPTGHPFWDDIDCRWPISHRGSQFVKDFHRLSLIFVANLQISTAALKSDLEKLTWNLQEWFCKMWTEIFPREVFMKRPCLKVPDEMLFFLPVEIMSNETIQSFQMKFQDLEGCSTTVSSFVWTWLGEVRLKVACFLGKLWMHTWVCSLGYKWVYKVWPWL